MGTIRKNSSLKRRTLRKRGGAGHDDKVLQLGIKDENEQNLHIPVKKDKDGLYQLKEDEKNLTEVRSDGKPPEYNPNWRKFDQIAVNFKPKGGGKRKKTKRKYRKGKKTRKGKKSRKRARK